MFMVSMPEVIKNEQCYHEYVENFLICVTADVTTTILNM